MASTLASLKHSKVQRAVVLCLLFPVQVNFAPSLACESPLDLRIKSAVLADLFNLADIRPGRASHASPSQQPQHNEARPFTRLPKPSHKGHEIAAGPPRLLAQGSLAAQLRARRRLLGLPHEDRGGDDEVEVEVDAAAADGGASNATAEPHLLPSPQGPLLDSSGCSGIDGDDAALVGEGDYISAPSSVCSDADSGEPSDADTPLLTPSSPLAALPDATPEQLSPDDPASSASHSPDPYSRALGHSSAGASSAHCSLRRSVLPRCADSKEPVVRRCLAEAARGGGFHLIFPSPSAAVYMPLFMERRPDNLLLAEWFAKGRTRREKLGELLRVES